MKTRYAAVLVSAALAFAAAGCTSSVISDSPPATDTPAASTIPSATPSTAAATPTDTASATTASGCPVTAAVLLVAYNNNAELSKALVLGSGLSKVVCYQGFAVARTNPPTGTTDPATVLFEYNAPKASWGALTGGTDVPCGGKVPAAVIPHLPGCDPSGN